MKEHGSGRVRWDYEIPISRCREVGIVQNDKLDFSAEIMMEAILRELAYDIRRDMLWAGSPSVHDFKGKLYTEYHPVKDTLEVTLYLRLCYECAHGFVQMDCNDGRTYIWTPIL